MSLAVRVGLAPIMIGADVMKRMAAPMFGGLLTRFVMELLVYPALFLVAKPFEFRRQTRGSRHSHDEFAAT